MKTTILRFFVAAGFAVKILAQFAQTLTTDPQVPGKLIYVPSPGSTSSVAAPIAVPTLVYNCYMMPLICENVASWAKSVRPNGNGDLGPAQTFYFDPDDTHKQRRRGVACGCFRHDDCSTAVSNGKQAGVSVQTIARSGGDANAFSGISLSNSRIILAGTNPPRDPITGQPTTPRLPLNSIPGRFFADGIAFSCDEFPAATFINGGKNAKTICALQSWQIFSGADVQSTSKPGTWPNTGKWPLPPASGIRMEQDWQAQSHVYLRSAFGIGGKPQQQGWGTVYPFSFTTTTIQDLATKAYVVNPKSVTQLVNKRDEGPTTTIIDARTITVVSDNLEERRYSETEEQPDATTKLKFADVRVDRANGTRQSLSACFSSSTILPCSMVPLNVTSHADSFRSKMKSFSTRSYLNTVYSASKFPLGKTALNMTQSTARSLFTIPSLLSIKSTISSHTRLSNSSNLASPKSFSESSFSNNDTSHYTSYTRISRSAIAESLSTTFSVLSDTIHFSSTPVAHVNISLTTAIAYSLSSSEPTLKSRPPRISSPLSTNDMLPPVTTSHQSNGSTSLSRINSVAYLRSFLTSIRFTSQTESIVSPAATVSSIGYDAFASSIPKVFAALVTSQALASTTGDAEAAYSATAISSGVAAASGYAMLLKLDSSDKSKARRAQKSVHDSLNLALDFFHHSHGSSPLGRALSALITILTKASSVVDAAVDASTPDDEEQDAEELVSDLEEAVQDAEKVREEEGNDDDDETTATTSTTFKTSAISRSESSQRDKETSNRISTSASFTSSSLSSSVTSYAPSAAPSVCSLSFDILGDEDVEVGDAGYDPSTGDFVGCVPVIGIGGVASGCALVQSATVGPDTWAETSSIWLGTVSTSLAPTNPAVVPVLISNEQPKMSSQLLTATPSTESSTICIPDGAPWMSPASWCDCGTAKYSTTPNCAFTNPPSNLLTPMITTSIPTNIPSSDGVPACTDCSYTLQPTDTLWTPSSITTATLTSLITAAANDYPHYPVTTILVLITTVLPPLPRPTIYSTVYIDPPPPPTPTTTTDTSLPLRQTLPAIMCINEFSNVDESLCWANCVGGTCYANENPFLNSEPWHVCSGCL